MARGLNLPNTDRMKAFITGKDCFSFSIESTRWFDSLLSHSAALGLRTEHCIAATLWCSVGERVKGVGGVLVFWWSFLFLK